VNPVEDDDGENGEPDVQPPEQLRRLRDSRCEFVDVLRLRLCLHQLCAADAELRQNRRHEDENAQPAEPLDELPPHQYRPVVYREIQHDRRTGRRQPTHGLEQRVDRMGDVSVSGDDKRYRADGSDGKPDQCNREKRLTGAKVLVLTSEGSKGSAKKKRRDDRCEKRQYWLGVVHRKRKREPERGGEIQQYRAGQRQTRTPVDANPTHLMPSLSARRRTLSRRKRRCGLSAVTPCLRGV